MASTAGSGTPRPHGHQVEPMQDASVGLSRDAMMKTYRKLWNAYTKKKSQLELAKEALSTEASRKAQLSAKLRDAQLALLNREAEAARESSKVDQLQSDLKDANGQIQMLLEAVGGEDGSSAPSSGSMFGMWSGEPSKGDSKLKAALMAVEKEKQRAARASSELGLLRDVREGELQALRSEIRRLQQQADDAGELAAARGDMLHGVRALARRERASMDDQLEAGAESRDRLVVALRRQRAGKLRAEALAAASLARERAVSRALQLQDPRFRALDLTLASPWCGPAGPEMALVAGASSGQLLGDLRSLLGTATDLAAAAGSQGRRLAALLAQNIVGEDIGGGSTGLGKGRGSMEDGFGGEEGGATGGRISLMPRSASGASEDELRGVPLGTGAALAALRAAADGWLEAAEDTEALAGALRQMAAVVLEVGLLGAKLLVPQRDGQADNSAGGEPFSRGGGFFGGSPGRMGESSDSIRQGLQWLAVAVSPRGTEKQGITVMDRAVAAAGSLRAALGLQASVWRAGLRQWRASQGLPSDERVDLVQQGARGRRASEGRPRARIASREAAGLDRDGIGPQPIELASVLGAEDAARMRAVCEALEHATGLLESVVADKEENSGSTKLAGGEGGGISLGTGQTGKSASVGGAGGPGHATSHSDAVQGAVAACSTVLRSAAVALQLAAKAGAAASDVIVENAPAGRLARLAAQPPNPAASGGSSGIASGPAAGTIEDIGLERRTTEWLLAESLRSAIAELGAVVGRWAGAPQSARMPTQREAASLSLARGSDEQMAELLAASAAVGRHHDSGTDARHQGSGTEVAAGASPVGSGEEGGEASGTPHGSESAAGGATAAGSDLDTPAAGNDIVATPISVRGVERRLFTVDSEPVKPATAPGDFGLPVDLLCCAVLRPSEQRVGTQAARPRAGTAVEDAARTGVLRQEAAGASIAAELAAGMHPTAVGFNRVLARRASRTARIGTGRARRAVEELPRLRSRLQDARAALDAAEQGKRQAEETLLSLKRLAASKHPRSTCTVDTVLASAALQSKAELISDLAGPAGRLHTRSDVASGVGRVAELRDEKGAYIPRRAIKQLLLREQAIRSLSAQAARLRASGDAGAGSGGSENEVGGRGARADSLELCSASGGLDGAHDAESAAAHLLDGVEGEAAGGSREHGARLRLAGLRTVGPLPRAIREAARQLGLLRPVTVDGSPAVASAAGSRRRSSEGGSDPARESDIGIAAASGIARTASAGSDLGAPMSPGGAEGSEQGELGGATGGDSPRADEPKGVGSPSRSRSSSVSRARKRHSEVEMLREQLEESRAVLQKHVELLVGAQQEAADAKKEADRLRKGYDRQLLTITERLVRLQQTAVGMLTLLDDASVYVPPELRASVAGGGGPGV